MNKLFVGITSIALYAVATHASAVALTLQPSSQIATPGDSISLDLVIGGLGNFTADSLSVFDIDLAFDDSALSFSGYSLHAFLGDTAFGEAIDISFGEYAAGLINIAELSLLDADIFSGPSLMGPYLDDIQPESFTLASLDFFVDVLPTGTSTSVFIDTVYALGDGYGDPLTLDSTTAAVIKNPGVTTIPEPGTLFLFGLGLIALFMARKRGYC